MSYYNHPFFNHHQSRYAHPFAGQHAQHYGPRHPHHFPYGSPFEYDAAPATRAAATDLEEEERAALAHLRSIQQRREAEQAAIRKEAQLRLQAEKEREAAIQRAIEAEKRREKAIAEAAERQRQQHDAIRAAVEHRRAAIREAAEHRQNAIREAIEHRHAAEVEKKRRFEEFHRARQQRFEEAMSRRAECAKRCAAKYAQRATRSAAQQAKTEYKTEFEALNGVLGQLFGINLVEEEKKDEEVKNDEVEKPKDAEKEKKEVKFEEKATSQSAPKPAEDQTAFPEDVNDLLTQFLGLRIEPTNATSGNTASNEAPKGLNEFLSRFGLVFEPLDIEKEVQSEKKTAAPATESTITHNGGTSSKTEVPAPPYSAPVTVAPVVVADPPEPTLAPAPAPGSSTAAAAPKNDEAPLTSFLNSFTDLPPFVRDILGNVELAFKEELNNKKQEEQEVQGKGKGVAPGEKKERPNPTPTPAPVPGHVDPIAKLSDIAHELDLVRESFTFPPSLTFSSSITTDAAPALLFNKTNSTYHAQANKLLQLLLAADGISSGGNKDVRKKRKEVVSAVEKEIEALEKRRDQVWEDVRERRQRGEESEHEHEFGSGTTSTDSSVVDAEEKHTSENVEVDEPEHVHQEVSTENDQQDEAAIKGYEIPASTPPEVHKEVPQTTENPEKPAEEVKEVEHGEEKPDRAAKVEDEEYEVL